MTSDAHRKSGRTAAFFDVDNTVVRGASAFHLARGLWQRDYFTFSDIVRFGWATANYTLFGESKEQLDHVREHGLEIIKGWSVAEMTAVGEEVYDELLAMRIFPGTKAIIDSHLARGHEVWLVTASPIEIGRMIARRLGATGALGTEAEHVGGYYTGKLNGGFLHGDLKATRIRELAERTGIDLARSHAYGDSLNDVPMLEAVGKPCPINPDPRMRKLARDRGWPVREFRKRSKSGRRGIVKSSITGAAWVTIQVGRGIRAAIRTALRLPRRRGHADESKDL
ncbi:HAD family hydrolase [Demequina pelophila]|uniref:HAD family hydrolase n=1 Tax=Demequina pelophila TaxID=1638984 RepID=UPI00078190CD|nr:HAD-IB family hydrolase [Demequina pelophila]